MQITVEIEGKPQVLDVPDDATPEEIDEIVNAGAAVAPTDSLGKVEGVARTMQRGLTLGFDDEIIGIGEALLAKARGDTRSVADIYSTFRAGADRQVDDFAAQNPNTAALAEGTGGALPALATMGAGAAPAVARTTAGVIGEAGALGAATGGLAGWGSADPGERAQSSVQSAAIGGLLGTGLAGGSELLGRFVAPKLSAAKEKILQALSRDGLTPGEVATKIADQQALGKPAGIVDVAGDNTRGLGRSIVTLPGQGRQTAVEALNTRADDQATRVIADVEAGTGRKAVNSDAMLESMKGLRGKEAQVNYDEQTVMSKELPGMVMDQENLKLLQSVPAFKEAWEGVVSGLGRAGEPVPKLFDAQGRIIRTPTVNDIDYIKRGLDAEIYTAKGRAMDKAQAYEKPSLGSLEARREELLARVDQLAPEYKDARSAFANDTERMEALELGQKFVNMPGREFSQEFGKLTPAQREIAKTGAVDAVRMAVQRASDNAARANVVKSIFGAGNKQSAKAEQLKQLFNSPEEWARFEQQMLSEVQMHETRQFVTGGSQTANKLADASDSLIGAEDVARAGVELLGGNPKTAGMLGARNVVGGLVDRWKSGITEGTRSEMADQLFNFEGKKAVEFLRELDRVKMERDALMSNRRRPISGRVVGVAGVAGTE